MTGAKHRILVEKFPVVISKLIDELNRLRSSYISTFGESASDAVSHVLNKLSNLRYELMTNKNISKFDAILEKDLASEDAKVFKAYDQFINENYPNLCKFHDMDLYFAEDYIYKRIHGALLSSGIPTLPVFSLIRREHISKYDQLMSTVLSSDDISLEQLLRLSAFAGAIETDIYRDPIKEEPDLNKPEIFLQLCSQESSCIAVNDSAQIMSHIVDDKKLCHCVIFPNSFGPELLFDLKLAMKLLEDCHFRRITFVLHKYPRLVNGVTREHIDEILQHTTGPHGMSERIETLIEAQRIDFLLDDYFEGPFDLSLMKESRPVLFERIFSQLDQLVILKGDRWLRSWLHTGSDIKSVPTAAFIISLRCLLSDYRHQPLSEKSLDGQHLQFAIQQLTT